MNLEFSLYVFCAVCDKLYIVQHRKKFGATSPPFIDYVKEILRRYPDGGQILKVD